MGSELSLLFSFLTSLVYLKTDRSDRHIQTLDPINHLLIRNMG